MVRLRLEIQNLCLVRIFTNIEKLVGVTTKLEKVLGELRETLYEPLKEEQEGIFKTMMEKQVIALNNTLINFFKGMQDLQGRKPFSHHLSEIE
jgi:hypothetical protein